MLINGKSITLNNLYFQPQRWKTRQPAGLTPPGSTAQPSNYYFTNPGYNSRNCLTQTMVNPGFLLDRYI